MLLTHRVVCFTAEAILIFSGLGTLTHEVPIDDKDIISGLLLFSGSVGRTMRFWTEESAHHVRIKRKTCTSCFGVRCVHFLLWHRLRMEINGNNFLF